MKNSLDSNFGNTTPPPAVMSGMEVTQKPLTIPMNFHDVESLTREEMSSLAKAIFTGVKKGNLLLSNDADIETIKENLEKIREELIATAQPKRLSGNGEEIYDNSRNPDGIKIGKARDVANIIQSLRDLQKSN
jgi:hypothetical protein